MGKPNKMTTCKHCGSALAASAKACPKCGGKNKKPIYKRLWFIVLMVLIVLGVIGSAFGGGDSSKKQNSVNSTASTNASTAETKKQEAQEISYTPYAVKELLDDLKNNALKATDKYQGQYVELTGYLRTIDSDGKYITITSDDKFAIQNVQCFIKNDEQKSIIMEKSSGDQLVVKGKIKSVGEVLGYGLDIDEVK